MKKILLFSLFLTVGTAFITSCNKCRQCEYAYQFEDDSDPNAPIYDTITKSDEKCANSNDDLDAFESDFEQEIIDKENIGVPIVSELKCNQG